MAHASSTVLAANPSADTVHNCGPHPSAPGALELFVVRGTESLPAGTQGARSADESSWQLGDLARFVHMVRPSLASVHRS